MDNFSKYESRIGKVNAGSEEIFAFVSDMRNFKRFLPEKTVKNWEASVDECSFEVSPVGRSTIKIVRKDAYDTVKFAGRGMNNTEFYIWVQLKELGEKDTRAKLTIKADLNTGLKMIASKPIKNFLNKMVSGMEEFDDWGSINP
ncbi:MAG: SRPBCC domain-containing protein [Bacteroidales bacterium]